MQKKLPFFLLLSFFLIFPHAKSQLLLNGFVQEGEVYGFARDLAGFNYLGITLSPGDSLGGVNYATGLYSKLAVVKYDDLGSIIWTSVVSYEGSYSVFSMDVDSSGRVMVAGRFSDSISWGGITLYGCGGINNKTFVAKLDASGNPLWIKDFSACPAVQVTEVKALSGGNFAVAGPIFTATTFNGFSFGPVDSAKGYVMILDNAGTVLNAFVMDPVGQGSIKDVEQGLGGDLWISGSFNGDSATWLGTTIPGTGPGLSQQGFVTRMTLSGTTLWTRCFDSGQATLNSICLDAAGNCYFTGAGNSLFTIGGFTGGVNNGPNYQCMVAGKLNSSGLVQWINNSTDSGIDNSFMYDISHHSSGKLIVVGLGQNLAGSFSGLSYSVPSGTNNTIIMVLDDAGNGISLNLAPPSPQVAFIHRIFWKDETHFILAGYGYLSAPLEWDNYSFLPFHSGYMGFFGILTTESNLVRGIHFADLDLNGSFSIGDIYVPWTPVSSSNGSVSITNGSGEFQMNLPQGSFNISASPASNLFSVSPASIAVNFPSVGGADSTLVFRSVPASQSPDLFVYGITPSFSVNGQNQGFFIGYGNEGAASQNGTITLNLDSHVSYVSATPVPDSISASHLAWNITGIAPLSSNSINLVLWVDSLASLGDTLQYEVAINPTAGDYDPFNQNDTVQSDVITSFDPNEKQVEPTVTDANYVNSGGWVTYKIHFQNTGNAEAYRVVLRDTLENSLDIADFEMIASSHPVVVHLYNQNLLIWEFDPIVLSPSSVNFAASSGFVLFRIKTQPGQVQGTSILNRAGIYFDFNQPVVTADAVLSLTGPLNINKPKPQSRLSLYPNPSRADWKISGFLPSDFPAQLKAYNAMGQEMGSWNLQNSGEAEYWKWKPLVAGEYSLIFFPGNGNKIVLKGIRL